LLLQQPVAQRVRVAPSEVRAGDDGDELEAGPGDILVVGAHTPHKFKNVGDERLDIVCIHDSPRMVQEDLE